MINANGHAFIIDFGSSILLQPSAASTTSLHDKSPGNPRWMAPETMQLGRYPITPKADVWSFAGLGIEVNCMHLYFFLAEYADLKACV
jgi:serine/threonine protein kinase